METIRAALDLKDRIAAHSGDADHHARESNEVGTIAELTDVAAEFSDSPPNRDHLSAALDTKDRLAAHGVKLPMEEVVWREELEEGIGQALNS
ncbi:hypothetical protein COHA_004672 [Chlorella ohadii]|uniref:Uncharacterized protein n=1 Tax=Chlorella ohadii TaxID=2649997 RepID=A0AAD5DP92_9CHLO|nr:hypothetical protein COHA_004672 [Chlorella ohadii]